MVSSLPTLNVKPRRRLRLPNINCTLISPDLSPLYYPTSSHGAVKLHHYIPSSPPGHCQPLLPWHGVPEPAELRALAKPVVPPVTSTSAFVTLVHAYCIEAHARNGFRLLHGRVSISLDCLRNSSSPFHRPATLTYPFGFLSHPSIRPSSSQQAPQARSTCLLAGEGSITEARGFQNQRRSTSSKSTHSLISCNTHAGSLAQARNGTFATSDPSKPWLTLVCARCFKSTC